MKTTLIEKRTQEGQYGMDTESMILDTDHPRAAADH